MVIVTNPGANLSARSLAHYGIVLTPQRIIVEGVEHSTRVTTALATVDDWVRTAKDHPYTLGTTAAEAAEVFRRIAETDPEIVVITASRKIIGTYTASVAAARAIQARDPRIKIAVIDTAVTDIGAGLTTMFAAEAARAGHAHAQVVSEAENFSKSGRMVIWCKTLDYLVKGGRASAMRAWLAKQFDVTPLLGFVDGEPKLVGRIPVGADIASKLAEKLAELIGPRCPVWCGITHSENFDTARRLMLEIEDRFDVRGQIIRQTHPSIYLHVGPGSIGCAVYPLDTRTWVPAPPFGA